MYSRIPEKETGHYPCMPVMTAYLMICIPCLLIFYDGALCSESQSGGERPAVLRENTQSSFEYELKNYRIEVVSATTYVRARAITDKLKSLLGKPVYIKTRENIWKIQIGGFVNFQDIKETIARLKEIGIKNARGIDIRRQSREKKGGCCNFIENEFSGNRGQFGRVFRDMSRRYHVI